MIADSSRYAAGKFAWVDHPTRGRVQVVHLYPVRWRNAQFSTYQSTSADQMDFLSHKLYGDARRYWVIGEMNPEVVHPDDLVAGDILRLPIEPDL